MRDDVYLHISMMMIEVKTETRPRIAHEVPLLTATASHVIDIGDTAMTLGSSGTPAAIEKSPLDFADEDPHQVITERGDEAAAEAIPESGLEKEVTTMGPIVNKRRRKRGNKGAEANAPPKVLRKDHVASCPSQSTLGGKSSRKTPVTEDPNSEKSTSFTSMVGSPGSIYQPRWGVTNNCSLDTPNRIEAREKHIKNLEALLEAEADMKGAVEAKNVELTKELESLRAQIMGEEKIKAAFEEFKNYEDDRVNSRCHQWVIGHGLSLAVIKCAEYTKLRQVCVDVVFAEIAKGMSQGLKHGVEHKKAKVDLATIEAYDHEADTKYVAALHALEGFEWIRKLHPRSSQLKIFVYLEKSRRKEKEVSGVYRTYRVGFAHHDRSDGVLVSIPTVALQGLSILLADAATQTEITEDEASPRLLKSKSLPPMYNLDWP
nr:hypothetical protein [Tanacetum cinerariifolium]